MHSSWWWWELSLADVILILQETESRQGILCMVEVGLPLADVILVLQ
jgi:hypothetical protein